MILSWNRKHTSSYLGHHHNVLIRWFLLVSVLGALFHPLWVVVVTTAFVCTTTTSSSSSSSSSNSSAASMVTSSRSHQSILNSNPPTKGRLPGDYNSNKNGVTMNNRQEDQDDSSKSNHDCDMLDATQLPNLLPKTETLHLIVLAHGWMGNSKELGYLQQALQEQLPQEQATTNTQVIVYSAIGNEGKTFDGIANGGTRLAREINQLVHYYSYYNQLQSSSPSDPGLGTVTLSLVGNSLGGLYTRHALSQIEWKWPKRHPSSDKEHEEVRNLIPHWFVTTCTPHLGVSQHTYIPIPQLLEEMIATGMQQTGLDLFRYRSTIIKELTVSPQFVQPLMKFQKRVAYANAFGTDFQVPTATAAFLAPNSPSKHEVVHDIVHDNDEKSSSTSTGATCRLESSPSPPKNIILQVKTTQRPNTQTAQLTVEKNSDYNAKDDILFLSQQLDDMGWTKVLVDVREHLVPLLPLLPFFANNNNNNDVDDWKKKKQQKNSFYTAKELYQQFVVENSFGHFPLGHTVSVANSKDGMNRYLTRGGKPIMDYLARTLIESLPKHMETKKQLK